MAKLTNEGTFQKLQAAWREAWRVEREYRRSLEWKYGTDLICIHTNKGERDRIARNEARESKTSDALFAWLDANSPRDWRHDAPCGYVANKLTYADAITPDALSVVPPPSYGRTEADMQRFAWPVSVSR